MYQLVGLLAIAVGLIGTWIAARRRSGWLLNIASTVMWLPALVTGDQWAAVLNCALSIAICVRNFTVQRESGKRERERELVSRPTIIRLPRQGGGAGHAQEELVTSGVSA